MFKRRETVEEISDRVLNLTDGGDYGLISPPMDAQVAVNELARHLLGDNYYTISLSNAQCNTEIVYDIETKYRKRVDTKFGMKLKAILEILKS